MDIKLTPKFQERVAAIKSKLGNRPIYLTGMMCSGKTILGRKLADLLEVGFADADDLIVSRVKRNYSRDYKDLDTQEFPIQHIFKVSGEPWFRERERNTVAGFAKDLDRPSVLALGGGAFDNDDTRTVIKETGISIFLNASVRVLNQRLSANLEEIKKRPLLSSDPDERLAQLQRLIVARNPNYKKADITFDVLEPLNLDAADERGDFLVKEEPVDDTVVRLIDTLYTHLNP